MEYTPLPPSNHEPSRRTRETAEARLGDTEARFRTFSFDELRAFCAEHEPTAMVGIFVLAERRYPYDSNPEAKYLMITDMLTTLATLHMASVDEEVQALEAAFRQPSATDSNVPKAELAVQQEFLPNEDTTG